VNAADPSTGNCTIAIDQFGLMTTTRAGGATGTVQQEIVDVGTTAPTT
jgi:hypothetical protein